MQFHHKLALLTIGIVLQLFQATSAIAEASSSASDSQGVSSSASARPDTATAPRSPDPLDYVDKNTNRPKPHVLEGWVPSKVTFPQLLKKSAFMHGHWMGELNGARVEEFWQPGKASLEGYRLGGAGPTILCYRTLSDNRTIEGNFIEERSKFRDRNCQLRIGETSPANQLLIVDSRPGGVNISYSLQKNGRLKVALVNGVQRGEHYYLTRIDAHPSSLPALKKRCDTVLSRLSGVIPWSEAEGLSAGAEAAESADPPRETTYWQRYLACAIAGNDEAFVPKLSKSQHLSYLFCIKDEGSFGRVAPGPICWQWSEDSEHQPFKELLLRTAPLQYRSFDYRPGEWYEASLENGFVSVQRYLHSSLFASQESVVPISCVRAINGHDPVKAEDVAFFRAAIGRLPRVLRDFMVRNKNSIVLSPTLEEVTPVDLRMPRLRYEGWTNGTVGAETDSFSTNRIFLYLHYFNTTSNAPYPMRPLEQVETSLRRAVFGLWDEGTGFSDSPRFISAYTADLRSMSKELRKQAKDWGMTVEPESSRNATSYLIGAALLDHETAEADFFLANFPRVGKLLRERLEL